MWGEEKNKWPIPNLLQGLDNPKNLENFLALAGSGSAQLGLTGRQFKEIVKAIAKTRPQSDMEVLQGLKDETFGQRAKQLELLIAQEKASLRSAMSSGDKITSPRLEQLLECQGQLSKLHRELEGVSAFAGSGGKAILKNENLREFMEQFGAMLGKVDSLLKYIDSNRVPEQTASNGWNPDMSGWDRFTYH